MTRKLEITREGSPIKITFNIQDMAANVLDFVLEAKSLDQIREKRVDGDAEGVVATLIGNHIMESIESAHTHSAVKPVCTFVDE